MPTTTRSKKRKRQQQQQAKLELELFRRFGDWNNLNFDRVRELIEVERVNVNCTDARGMTPLLLAARLKNDQVARLVLENGANVHATDENGKTALWLSIYDDDDLQRANVTLIELLLQAGANVETQIRNSSMLGRAIGCRKADLVRIFLRFGANTEVTLYNAKIYSALYIACRDSSIEVVQILLEHGVDMNAISPRSFHLPAMTPLCKACIRNSMEIAQLLVQHGARVIHNGEFPNSPCPLMHAVRWCPLELVRFLLDHSPYSGNDNARLPPLDVPHHPLSPPLESAVRLGKLDMAQLLVDRGANVNDRAFLWLCVRRDRCDMARLLLRAAAGAANVNRVDNETGQTPLWAAAEKGQVELVQEFLKARADVRIRDNNGETPLGVAYRKGHKDIVYLLLRTSPHVWSKLAEAW